MVANSTRSLALQRPNSRQPVHGERLRRLADCRQPFPYVDASLMNFFRPGGLNPSIAGCLSTPSATAACVGLQRRRWFSLASQGFNANCDPNDLHRLRPLRRHGCQLLQRQLDLSRLHRQPAQALHNHYEFLASYTWSHAIDDSTDLQSTLTPQDSYFPALTAPRRSSISATASSSAASIRPASWAEAASAANSSATGHLLQSWRLLPAGHSTSSPATATISSSRP